jgi:heptosyltransferase-2
VTLARLLVRLPNWLGDIVMSLPALAAVRARWPDARLTLALPRAFAPLVDAIPTADEALPLAIGRGWRDRATFAADVEALRAGNFDAALLLTNSFASALMASRAGIPERWGYRADLRGTLLTRAVPRRRARTVTDRHHSRYYLRLVEALGCEGGAREARLRVPPEWRDRGAGLLAHAGVPAGAPIVGVAPGAAYGAAKQYPPALVARVIARCLAERGAWCVLLGARGDAAAGAEVLRHLGRGDDALASAGGRDDGGARVVDLIGATDLPALAGVMAHCASVLCNDSGAMHLAAAIGVHVVVPFGATDEHATAPLGPHAVLTGRAWCRPCLRRECPIDHRCMWTIDSGRVFDALR